jgi:uncharacterized membrane protein
MRRWLLGAVMALVALGAAAATSYVALKHFYGERYIVTSTQTVTIENSGQRVTIDNVQYNVENAEFVVNADNVNFYLLDLIKIQSYTSYENTPSPPAPSSAPLLAGTYSSSIQISMPREAYEQAQATGGPVTISNTTTTETKPIDALPIAASIGIAAGVTVFAVWIGYRQAWGDATSTLLEQGLHDMTVRDIEIVGYIMQKGEFTIPELMKLTNASKITIWRTVQKLEEQGLVKRTEQTKPAANGLGGRGKPSQIYKYVGEKNKPPTSSGTSSEPKQVP